jgi:hypothetical protein
MVEFRPLRCIAAPCPVVNDTRSFGGADASTAPRVERLARVEFLIQSLRCRHDPRRGVILL